MRGQADQYVAVPAGPSAPPLAAYNPYWTEVQEARHPYVKKTITVCKNHGVQNVLAPLLMLSNALLYDFYLNPQNPHYPDRVYKIAGVIGIASAFLFFLAKVADHGSAVRASQYNLRHAFVAQGLIDPNAESLDKSRAARVDQALDFVTTGGLITSAVAALNHNPNIALGFVCGAAALKGAQFGLRGLLGEARYTQITGRNYTAQFTRQQKMIQYSVYALIIGAFAAGVQTIRHAATTSGATPNNNFHSPWGIATVAFASFALYLYFMPNMMRGTDAYERAVERRSTAAAESKPHINTLEEGCVSRRDVKQELAFLAIQLLLAGGIALATKATSFTVVPAVGAALFVATGLAQLATATAKDDQKLANAISSSTFMTREAYLRTEIQTGESNEAREASPASDFWLNSCFSCSV